jgi:transmembrane sensor
MSEKELYRLVAETQDDALSESGMLDEARERMFGLKLRESPGLARPLVLLAASLCVLAASILFLLQSTTAPLTYEVDGVSAGLDLPIEPAERRESSLRFSDGSSVVLSAGARARVTTIRDSGAEIIVERGRAHVAVVHRATTRWLVRAGRVDVTVTGTAFDVTWDESTETFSLAMTEGTVVLGGACVPSPRVVSASQSVRLECSARTNAGRTADPVGETTATIVRSPPSAEVAPSKAQPVLSPSAERRDEKGSDLAPGTNAPPVAIEVPVSWRELVAAGKHAEALASAERAGFESECAQGSAADLLTLADVARLGGNMGRAQQALLVLRRRFPGDPRAAGAAFTLGQMAFDQRGAYGEAASMFSAYLREQPNGSLTREALGRLIEARQRSGDRAGARSAARAYLERHPSGPHAELARSLAPE